MKYVIFLEYLTVSGTGHARLKKNLGQKQRDSGSTLTNMTKVAMSFLT